MSHALATRGTHQHEKLMLIFETLVLPHKCIGTVEHVMTRYGLTRETVHALVLAAGKSQAVSAWYSAVCTIREDTDEEEEDTSVLCNVLLSLVPCPVDARALVRACAKDTAPLAAYISREIARATRHLFTAPT